MVNQKSSAAVRGELIDVEQVQTLMNTGFLKGALKVDKVISISYYIKEIEIIKNY